MKELRREGCAAINHNRNGAGTLPSANCVILQGSRNPWS